MANLDVYKFLLVSKHCFSKKFHILSFNPNLGGFLVICFAVEGGEGGGGGRVKSLLSFDLKTAPPVASLVSPR